MSAYSTMLDVEAFFLNDMLAAQGHARRAALDTPARPLCVLRTSGGKLEIYTAYIRVTPDCHSRKGRYSELVLWGRFPRARAIKPLRPVEFGAAWLLVPSLEPNGRGVTVAAGAWLRFLTSLPVRPNIHNPMPISAELASAVQSFVLADARKRVAE